MEDYEVFVYCGGKCGSITLYETFKKNGYKTCHLHDNRYWISDLKKDYSIFDYIDYSSKYKKVYIIDCYRNPIERNISSFFQNIKKKLPKYNELTIDDIIEHYNINKLYLCEYYHPINEVLLHYGLPLFDNFNFEKHYNIVEKDNKVFIKILFSDIEQWKPILSEIFRKPIDIYSDNLTSNKDIYSLYLDFKKTYKITQDYYETHFINDNEFRIYNTVNEQILYLKYWM
jgi:hypothetical protein